MKHLLLFDIDGTLVSGGPAKDAYQEGLLKVYGTAGPLETHDFSGKTDVQIARELLTEAGLSNAEIDAGIPLLLETYLGGMADRLPEHPVETLPNAVELVERLAATEDVALGLVTGNVVRGARLKLSGPGLDGYFPVGGFGSDSEHRNDLPGIALERARGHWNTDFHVDRVVIIGDTPRDVECGKAHGFRTFGVATGRWSADSLRDAGADHIMADFRDLDEATARLLGEFA